MPGSLVFALVASAALAAGPCHEGAAALARRDLLSAEASLKQCIQASPAPLDAYLQLCAVYQFQQKPDALYQTAREGLKRFPQEKRFYIAAGTHEGQLRRYDQAIHILEEGYRRWAEDEKIRSLLASSYYARCVELIDATQKPAAGETLRRATQRAT